MYFCLLFVHLFGARLYHKIVATEVWTLYTKVRAMDGTERTDIRKVGRAVFCYAFYGVSWVFPSICYRGSYFKGVAAVLGVCPEENKRYPSSLFGIGVYDMPFFLSLKQHFGPEFAIQTCAKVWIFRSFAVRIHFAKFCF